MIKKRIRKGGKAAKTGDRKRHFLVLPELPRRRSNGAEGRAAVHLETVERQRPSVGLRALSKTKLEQARRELSEREWRNHVVH